MRNTSKPLRTAYLAALAGISVPIYDKRAPMDAPDHYVVIADQRSSEEPVKGKFISNARINLDIVTEFKTGGGMELSEDIANEILTIIRNGEQLDLSPDFQVVTCKKEDEFSLVEDTPSSTIYRTILTFEHKINQLN